MNMWSTLLEVEEWVSHRYLGNIRIGIGVWTRARWSEDERLAISFEDGKHIVCHEAAFLAEWY